MNIRDINKNLVKNWVSIVYLKMGITTVKEKHWLEEKKIKAVI